ncbi:hypothetical protein INS49_005867 [Diaporthe citri]|uniref:uncharacterized protein n=1 Tax=Diaporthe citri TaxID=83186 RepID=UPI001C80E748|nr:uncharacterized protein INS49_005867 [Diaporthe citri]KAG6364268.1 hypothetical protein INS49_005867 [Diaporthe citri]
MSQDEQPRLTAHGRCEDLDIRNSSPANNSGSMNASSVSDQGRIDTETSTPTGNISPGTDLQQRNQIFHEESDRAGLDSNTTIGNVAPADRQRSSRGEYEQVNKSHDKFQGEPLQHQPFPIRKRHRVLRFWIWEVLSICLAIGLLVAIVLVLSHFHGEIVPQWRFSINLNTLVALLATIARAAMLAAVAEILGQVKWSWFSRPRPLNNLQHFDKASRGLIGSLCLPLVASKNLVAVVGSLVVVLSLAIGPFSQQAIKSVDCLQNVSSMNASVPIAHFFGQRGLVTELGDLRADMKGAMINGLVNPTGNDSKITATCQTGNCTFQSNSNVSYSSIGLCSACVDTTPLVQIISTDDKLPLLYNLPNYTLPQGSGATIRAFVPNEPFLMATPSRDMSWAASAFTDFYKGVVTNSILNTSFLTFTRAPCTNVSGVVSCPHNVTTVVLEFPHQVYVWELDYVATSCTLYPCLKNYQATVQQGVLNEQVVSTAPTLLNGGFRYSQSMSTNFTVLRDPCVISDVEYNAASLVNVPRTAGRTFTNISIDGVNYTAPEECLYKLDWDYGLDMQNFMESVLFKGTCVAAGAAMEAMCEAWWLSPLYNSLNATFETISDAMDQFAEVITNKFRTSGSTNYDISQKDEALGVVTRMTICTAFDWQWLLLPLSLVATTAVLLILTVLQNLREHRQPVWKSSVLPLIFYGIDVRSLSLDTEEPQPVVDLDQLDELASRMRVRFQNGLDAGFVGVDDACGSDEGIDMDSLLTAEPVCQSHEQTSLTP